MEQVPRQNTQAEARAKRRGRHLIALLYRVEKRLFYLYLVYVGLLGLTLLSGLVFIRMAWGAFVLGGGVAWSWILPISLCVGFVFPLLDSFIQGSEEQWFARYGTTIIASVEGFDPVKSFNLRIFRGAVEEYRARLIWRHPASERMYTYSLRVRDQKLPGQGSPLPVVIDYDDPSYYLKKDIKDPALLI